MSTFTQKHPFQTKQQNTQAPEVSVKMYTHPPKNNTFTTIIYKNRKTNPNKKQHKKYKTPKKQNKKLQNC